MCMCSMPTPKAKQKSVTNPTDKKYFDNCSLSNGYVNMLLRDRSSISSYTIKRYSSHAHIHYQMFDRFLEVISLKDTVL